MTGEMSLNSASLLHPAGLSPKSRKPSGLTIRKTCVKNRILLLLILGCSVFFYSTFFRDSFSTNTQPFPVPVNSQYSEILTTISHNVKTRSGSKEQNVNYVSYSAEDLNEIISISSSTDSPKETPAFPELQKEEISCHLPDLKPFDSSILKYVETPSPVNCEETHPLIFKTDLNNTLIQFRDPKRYNYTNCCYKAFSKYAGSESLVVKTKSCLRIREKKTLIPKPVEFLEISCTNDDNGSVVVDLFGFVPLKKRSNSSKSKTNESLTKEEKLTKNDSKLKFNVLVLGIDAVSHMNFQRTMPLSFEYLTKNLSAIGMNGYVKVGDNTFPNIVPVTTGLNISELTKSCWNEKDYFDKCPFIWTNYSSQGYITAYGEDATWMGIFNYEKKGFRIPPTDYYYNTLTYKMDKDIGHENLLNANICYGPRLGFEILLDFIKKMAFAMIREQKQNYFQFIWATSLFHDMLNQGKLGDVLLLNTLKWLKSAKYMEDTILILMSDHGIRWGEIRETVQGKLEENMPFLYLSFPDWFSLKYQAAVSNLKRNENRLTTPFDLHETLKDLLHPENIENESIRRRHFDLSVKVDSSESGSRSGSLPRGISLFLSVPLRRNCADAEIPEHFCVCHSTKSINVENNTLIEEGARSVVYLINGMFIRFPQCQMLFLDEVISAQVFQVNNEQISDKSGLITQATDPRLNKQSVKFTLIFSVSPSDAKFEATTTRQTDGHWEVLGDISRINLYGSQSKCVSDYNLKKFCFCG